MFVLCYNMIRKHWLNSWSSPPKMWVLLSPPKTNDPRKLSNVVWTPQCRECQVISSTLPTCYFAWGVPLDIFLWTKALKIFPTIWCISSHMVLAVRFLLKVGVSLILHCFNNVWNFYHINSPPLSLTASGHWYLNSRVKANVLATWSAILQSTLTHSIELISVNNG